MKYKNVVIFICIYLFLFLSVGVLCNTGFLKDLPEVDVYDGPLEFSGDNAYESLKILTGNYSNRFVGTEKARESAEWVRDTFSKLGMEAYIEEFDCLTSKSSTDGDKPAASNGFSSLMGKSMNDLLVNKKGLNVIGISRGKSEEVIVIGAHRDMIGSVQGAEDNGSGTVTMLELARVLAGKEHYHTYAFVSFDGEEVGLKGSEFFVKNNKALKIKAAVVMDMVGFKEANALSFYQSFTGRGATQLWTMALANKVLQSMELVEYDFKSQSKAANPIGLFLRLLASRAFGLVNTDSGPFIDRNIPSIGLKSVLITEGQKGFRTGKIHEPSDTIEQVSAKSLEVSGRFAEKYVKSISQDGYKGNLEDNLFINYGSKYLGPANITGLLLSGYFVLILLLAMQIRNIRKDWSGFIRFLKQEKKLLIITSAYSAVAALFWQLLRYDIGRQAPVFIIAIVYLIAVLAGIIIILVLRFKALKKFRAKYDEVTAFQRSLLNLSYIAVFILLSITVNPFIAICLTFIPIMVLGRVSYRKEWMRIIWILIAVVWSLIHLIVMLVSIQSYIFDITSPKVGVISFLSVLTWALSLVYIISAPPMPLKIKPAISSAPDISKG